MRNDLHAVNTLPIISVNITRVDGVDNFSKRMELLFKTVFFQANEAQTCGLIIKRF